MRLIKLEANNSGFRAVKFNTSGLSIILGQKQGTTSVRGDRSKTYNGVGKSLCIALVHFCLGSKSVPAFQKHLKDWWFYLTIESAGRVIRIDRSTANQGDIRLDGKKVSLKGLHEWLMMECFEPTGDVSGLNFRPLIHPFLRSGRGAYSRFDIASEGEIKNEFGAMIRNAFLLGLDSQLADAKFMTRSRLVSLEKTVKQIESDPVFTSLGFGGNTDLEIRRLDEVAAKLERDLRSFTVADNYGDIRNDANRLKAEVERIGREIVKNEDSVGQVERSMKQHPDLDVETIVDLYAEVKIAWPTGLRRRVEEVIEFHRTLAARREFRLSSELTKLRQDLKTQRDELTVLNSSLDEKLRYLGGHMALDVYTSVSAQLADVRQKRAQLASATGHMEKVKRERRELSSQLTKQSVETDEYLDRASDLIQRADNTFRRHVAAIYGSGVASLSVTNNDGKNLMRFKINAHIPRDAAEGINEVKIFCYDMTILTLGRNHRVQFLGHDSSLFSPVDHRHRWEMIRLADATARKHGIQYIAAMNEHDMSTMRPTDAVHAAEFERIFSEPTVILRLTDRSPGDRLLGFDVDMDYWASSKGPIGESEA